MLDFCILPVSRRHLKFTKVESVGNVEALRVLTIYIRCDQF